MTQSVPVLGAHTVTLPVIPWRTETPALQPRKSPIHLSNSSSRPRFLVSSLKASGTFFVSQPNAKKGPVPSDGVVFAAWPVPLRRSLRNLQNDASIHLPSVVPRDGLCGARPECRSSLCGNSRTASHRQNKGSQDSGCHSYGRRRVRIWNGLFAPSSRCLRTSWLSIRLRQFAGTLHR